MKSQNFQIRQAKPTDAIPLAQCIKAAYAKYEGRITDLPPVSEGIVADIAEKQVWVAYERHHVIAGMILAPKPKFLKLVNLAVHPDHAGKGLGRRFMELAESEAQHQGFEVLQLRTHAKMPENVRLYEYLGWKIFAQDQDIVSMKKHVK